VDFFLFPTCLHKHKNAFLTWSYAEHVKKNPSTTPRQAKKNKATTNSNPIHKQSCGISKNKTLT
jgi:hypothetical protein